MASKRSHSNATASASNAPSTRPSKRAKPDGGSRRADDSNAPDSAVELLRDHADELIDYLRCLKTEGTQRGRQSAQPTSESIWTTDRVSTLFRTVLPAIETFATTSSHDATSATAPQTTKTATDPKESTATGHKTTALLTTTEESESDAGLLPAVRSSSIRKWEPEDFTIERPPLPQVMNARLEHAALTHSGNNEGVINYERLEWLGDTYLETIATLLIHHTFPDLREGRCAQIRELLVRNSTLAEFAKEFGLDKRAKLPQEFTEQGRIGGTKASEKQMVKVLGDLFEAYIGAIILSDPKHGVNRVTEWLRIVWAPMIEPHLKTELRREPASTILPKTQLERLIGAKEVKIEYRDLPSHKKHKEHNLPVFTVGCFLHGWGESDKQLGYGTALNKKEAGQNAAKMALENRKMLKPFVEKKEAYEKARAAAAK
ncbi:hypothetical protein OQA88_12213 [Cercophora sp. LCS_1]